MAMQVSELIRWLETNPDDAEVYIDEGGLTLVCEDGASYTEVGGKSDTTEADEEEEQE